MTNFSNFKPTVHKKNLLTAATFLFPVAGIGLLAKDSYRTFLRLLLSNFEFNSVILFINSCVHFSLYSQKIDSSFVISL